MIVSQRKQVDLLLKQGKVKEAVNLLSDLGACCSDAKQSRALFEECLALDSQHFESQANLALLDLEDDTVDISVKVKSFKNAVRINPQWFDGIKTLASLLDDCGNELGAIQMYRKALEVDPNNVDVMLDLVLMLSKSGDLAEALQTCKQALRLDSKHGKGNLMLAELLWRSGAAPPKQVVIFCQRALEFTKSASDGVIQLNACLVAATALEQDGNAEQAVEFLEIACSLANVDTTNARIRLNALLFALNKHKPEVLLGISPAQKEDSVGKAMLHALANECNVMPPQQREYSQLTEAFLLNSHFNDTFALIHKVSLYRNTVLVDSNALPKSHIVTTWEQVKRFVDDNGGGLYFLKNPSVQRGQGILLVNTNTPADVGNAFFAGAMGREFLLQEAVHPPLLLDGGYKFGLRTHVLVVNFAGQHHARSVFVFKESILTRCWDKYDVNKTDALTHISSTSIQRNQQGFNRDQVKGLASKMFASDYFQVFEKLKPKLFTCCQACLTTSTAADAPMFQLFGFDSVVRDGDLEPFIAEANAAPQFQDAKRTEEMLLGFALPMTHGACEIVCAGYEGRNTHAVKNWDYVGDLL